MLGQVRMLVHISFRNLFSSWINLIIGMLIIGGYGLLAFTGKEPGSSHREKIPADVRQSPGGYRSFHSVSIWHSGFRGGK